MKVHPSAWLLLGVSPAVLGVGATTNDVRGGGGVASAPTLFGIGERHLKKPGKGGGGGRPPPVTSGGGGGKGNNQSKSKGGVVEGEPDDMPDDWKARKEAMKNNKNVGKGLLTGATCESSSGGGGGGGGGKGGDGKGKGSALQGLDLSGGGCSSLASSSSSDLAPLDSVVIDETDPDVLASLGVNATDTTTEGGDFAWDSTNAPDEDERAHMDDEAEVIMEDPVLDDEYPDDGELDEPDDEPDESHHESAEDDLFADDLIVVTRGSPAHDGAPSVPQDEPDDESAGDDLFVDDLFVVANPAHDGAPSVPEDEPDDEPDDDLFADDLFVDETERRMRAIKREREHLPKGLKGEGPRGLRSGKTGGAVEGTEGKRERGLKHKRGKAQEGRGLKHKRGKARDKIDHAKRRLGGYSGPTYPIGDFAPLACNSDLHLSDCSGNLLSSLLGGASDPVVVPCGACFTYDLPPGPNAIGGLDVRGRLYVPPNFRSVLRTPYVFVQGELSMSDDNVISKDNESMRIVLTGDADVTFAPADTNANVAGTPFNAGTRPFLVAGGKLDIRGWDGDNAVDAPIQSWSPLVETAEGKLPVPIFREVPGMEQEGGIGGAPLTPPDRRVPTTDFPQKCPRKVVEHDFESDPHLAVWSGRDGNIVHHEGGALVVKDLKRDWQGLQLDFTEIVQECPLIDEATYLITAKIKIEHKDYADGTPMQCEIDGSSCPRLLRRIYHDDGSYDATEDRWIRRGVVGRWGEWFHFATKWRFKESENEMGSNVVGQTFLFEKFPIGSTVSMDDFVFELPSERSFLPQDGGADTCSETVINGDAEDNDGNGFHHYPMWSSNTGRFEPLVLEETDADGSVNRFYRTKARDYRGHSMRWNFDPQCFVRGYVFTVSHRMRISDFPANRPMEYWLRFKGWLPDEEKNAYPTILTCDPIAVEDGWKACSGPLLITEEMERMTKINVEVHFDGDGEPNHVGPWATVDWDDISVKFVSGPAEGLNVRADRASRWGANSDVHITSSTLYWKDSQLAVIDSAAADAASGTVTLKLAAGVDAVLSERETPGMGVEIALLTRNIIIEGEYVEGATAEHDGGYLQVLHTPGVAQVVEGVEFVRMGQKDVRNRHPVQLAYGKNVTGTSVSRNSVRDSGNGCVDVDGSSGAVVAGNVAHGTLDGHCYYVGYESTDNLLYGNLASVGHGDNGYQIMSPENDFVGNVAAGNYGRGFYMNIDWKTNGEDDCYKCNYLYSGGNMRRKTMGAFRGNVAHSNYNQGFLLYNYEQFFEYRDEVNVPVFEDLKAYRNREHGIYAYNVIAAEWRGGLLSDNQWGMLHRVSDRILIRDYTIVGSSREFFDHTKTRSLRLCSHAGWDHYGIEMPPAIHRLGHADPMRGMKLRNVTVSGFDRERTWYPNCKSTEPIHMGSDKKDGHFDYLTSSENVVVADRREPSMIVDGCLAAVNPGTTDIVINDVDGSLDPSGRATSGALVSNSPHVTGVFGDNCADIGNCMAYCPDVCLRSLYLRVEQFGTENWKLYVNDTATGHTMLVPPTVTTQSTPARSRRYFSDPNAGRRFSINLPAGRFTARFVDEAGDEAWPAYVEEMWQKEPDCEGHATPGDVIVLEPSDGPDCEELFRNGGRGDSAVVTTEPWVHSMYDYRSDDDIAVGAGLGRNGSDAIVTYNREVHWQGPGQNIDSRCVKRHKDEFYEFSAWMKVTAKGHQPQPAQALDVNGEWNWNKAPQLSVNLRDYRDPSTKEFMKDSYQADKAHMSRTYDVDGFNLLHGIFRLPDAHRLWIEIERAPDHMDFVMDDVSLSKMSCDPNELLRNGDLETGNSMYWDTWGGQVGLEAVSPGYGGAGHALRSFNRHHDSYGFAQVLNMDCANTAGDRLAFSARVKVLDGDTGATIPCDPFTYDKHANPGRCPDVYLHTSNPDNNKRKYERLGVVGTSEHDAEDGWYLLSGTIVLTDEMVGPRMFSKLYFAGTHERHSLVIDDASLRRLPGQCAALVLNPSMEEGSAYWENSDRQNAELSLYSPGAGGEGDLALRSHARDHQWRGLRQKLDDGCFVEGEEYEISAKFRMLDASGNGVPCNVNTQQTNIDVCPSVTIYGHYCPSSNVYWRFYNALGGDDLSWDPDSFNDFSAAFTVNDELAQCKHVYVYVHEVHKDHEIVVDDLQISSLTTGAPTMEPTTGATDPSTEGDTAAPTGSPTTRPTVAAVTTCPEALSTPAELPAGPVMLGRSDALCVLTKAVPTPEGDLSRVAPVALSYDGADWEKAAGDFATELLRGREFKGYSAGSHITLPDLDAGQKYYLTSYSHTASERDKVARLLETATFGTTAADLDAFLADRGDLTSASAKAWIKDQMHLPLTSHREFFRLRSNARFTQPTDIGRNNHPCDAKSRWRNFAFSRKEGGEAVTNDQIFEAEYNSAVDAYATIKLNGHVRTVVSPELAFDSDSLYAFEYNKEYVMCRQPQEYADGIFQLRMEDNSCEELQNPMVHFYPDSVQPENVLDLPFISKGNLEKIDELLGHGGEYILRNGLTDPVCTQLNDVMEEMDAPVFGKLPDGSWLQFDPRIVLENNTLWNPIPDGGGLVGLLTTGKTRCANVPRTFLNEDDCFLSDLSTTCGAANTPNLAIPLHSDSIHQLHDITGKYVYGIVGLPLIDFHGVAQPWPCAEGLRSRWEILDAAECSQTQMEAATNASLTQLLLDMAAADDNELLRDVLFPVGELTCDLADNGTLVEVEMVIGSQCFRRVHPEHMSVYDFTYWTLENTHPGNMIASMFNRTNPITKWKDVDDSVFLRYPAFRDDVPNAPDQLANHGIDRWDEHSFKFAKLGRYGDTVKFVDLPNEIRLDEVAVHFGGDTELSGGGIMVCGSPHEVANDPSLGQVFDIVNGRDTEWSLWRQREYAWFQVGLAAPDQLRQRVAWALSQLLVIASKAISVERSHSEVFLGYYDVFVRHAFGNYRDVLREISFSPLMAENLSFLQSKSAAYMWETQDKISFADENFSREIMQLFSTGLVRLNLDGTPVLDELGQPVLAYTNDEIMSFARVWTGFDYQRRRGNVEETTWSGNRHDPMKIQPSWRDKFPKTDMTGGYIGDGYPRCADLPSKMFLRKGATYRLLGASHMPELQEDDSEFERDDTLRKFVLDEGSAIRTALCDADDLGACRYANTVTLGGNLECTAFECDADTLRVVQVDENVHYEFVRPACVEQVFYANAKKVIWKDRNYDSSCSNPLLPYASEACCEGQQDNVAERSPNYLYDQERVLYSTANSRCQAMGMGSCDFNSIEGIDHHKKGYHWTTDSCKIQVKVNFEGQVALVYEPDTYAILHPHVRIDNRNFFKVYWDGDFPINDADVKLGNNCGNGTCESLPIGGCLCDTTITETRVFREMPESIDEVLSRLTIGAYDTEAYDPGTYSAGLSANGVTAYLSGSTGAFDADTVFEVTDERGRLHRLRNAREYVRVQGAGEYAFRNAPSFMSVLNSEADARDAYYETEAALDHYFHHDNTAPFIALRMIQRFTTSNPKPRYVRAVATAFRTGNHDGSETGIGSRKYGCLAATIAAILLDPEARSVNLDADPFRGNLREPLLRMMALMRGMELELADGQHVPRINDLDMKIGQMAHAFPTVFSFFLPEYLPGGRPGDATLVGPETMIMDMPKVVGLLNGMFSLVKYGLSRCRGGFGIDYRCPDEGDYSYADAHLSFSMPYDGKTALEDHADAVVGELATILTSGRLGGENSQIIKDAYLAELSVTPDPSAEVSAKALRLALQLVLTTPEFHTNNIVAKTGALRAKPEPPTATGAPYRAIVYVMFGGGCDSFNMLVPHTCSGRDVYAEEYREVRQEIALEREELLLLDPVDNQVCERFGVHPRLGSLRQLFNDGDLLFFANTGVLTMPTDKENYNRDTVTQLFAHNFMQLAAQRVDPLKAEDGTGILGRIRDVLSNKGLSVGAFSIDVNSISLMGTPGVTASPMILGNNGVDQFNEDPSMSSMSGAIESLNGETPPESGVFGEWFSDVLLKSLAHSELLYNTLDGKTTSVTFPDSHLGRQMSMVAKMIDSREQRGTDADMFFIATGGWDTHSMVLENQDNLFSNVDAAFGAFAQEMDAMGMWDKVTLVETSDFGRTLTQNGGLGSDHAWGGNYIMMGGSVRGGQIVGAYPEEIKEGSELNIGRGRIIPTTSWEAVFLPLAEWAGVDEADFDYICPNRGRFRPDNFFNTADLFQV